MTFLLLSFLQARTPLSWVVVAGAVIAFFVGVWLFVYFFKRYKRIEKETEEDWDLSRRSLFVNAPSPGPEVEEADTSAAVEVEAPVAEEAPVKTGGTREFASDIILPSFTPEPEPKVETVAPPEAIRPETEAPAELRATKILASPSLTEAVSKPEAIPEDVAFDDEVWAGLDVAEQAPVTAEHEVFSRSPAEPLAEPLNVARVEERSQREPFETPQSDRASQVIEPLTPREAGATGELRSEPSPGIERPSGDHTKKTASWGTARLGSAPEDIPRPGQPPLSERVTGELAGELVAATPGMMPEPSLPKSAPRARMFGSVLGLPAEYSQQPLILGDPARPADEMGIGALTHYGKDLGPKGGRAGTIALFLVVGLLVVAAGLYFFVPAIHSRVGDFAGRLRGSDAQVLQAAMKPKAQIIPSTRLDPNKNMVTARGAVDNLTDEPLENLSVEVSLKRGGEAPPETRTIPVTPNPLPPRERGTFEFEYDGKRDTGFAGYTITRLLSNGTEVRFRAPGP